MTELMNNIIPVAVMGAFFLVGIYSGKDNLTERKQDPVLVKQVEDKPNKEEKQTIRRDPNKHYCVNCGKEAIFNQDDITSRLRKQLGFCNKCYNTQVSFKR